MGADHGFPPAQFGVSRRRPVQRNMPEPAIFVQRHCAEIRLADAGRVFQHRPEYGLQFARRTRNHAQHLRRCRLLLQRLGKLARARLHLVEQPHILDRDHRLVGECRNQFNLLLGERTHGRSRQIEHADRHAFPHQRYSQEGFGASTLGHLEPGVFGIRADVGNMNRAPLKRRSSDQRVAARFD